MIEIFLCDDRQREREQYAAKLRGLAKKHHLPVRIACFENGASLRFALEDCRRAPDLIYLDILMGTENGIDTGAFLRQHGCTSLLIYLTISRDYAVSSFRTRPFYYLLKDDGESDLFEQVFLSAVEEIKKGHKTSLTIKEDGSYFRILRKEILYLEVYGHQTLVHTLKNVHRCRLPLDKAEKELASYPFIRIHRSYLVNPTYIIRVDTQMLTLFSGIQVPVGKTYAPAARRAIQEFIHQL